MKSSDQTALTSGGKLWLGNQEQKKVPMKIAGGRIELGGMTVNGEVMVSPDDGRGGRPDDSTVRWIVPDDRMTTELGIRITKQNGKVILDKGPLKKKNPSKL